MGQLQEEVQVILVVDDQRDNLEAMEELLEDGNWRVHCVESGAEALRCLAEHEVGLVLLDVHMPHMDGFEVARCMRSDPRTRFTPIIFITGLAQTADMLDEGYTAGAVDFIAKPVQPTVLRHKVQVLLEHERYRSGLLRLTRQLESARAFNASILDNTAEGIMVVGEDGHVRFANPAITRMLDRSIHDLKGSELLNWIATPHALEWQQSEFYLHWQRQDTLRLHDASLRTMDGRAIPVTLSCSPLPGDQQAMVLLALDMTRVRDLHQQLESLAITDALTGLLNRRGFVRELQAAIARSERAEQLTAVLYLDLDGFKQINDSLGHETGDQLLRWVSDQLRAILRPYDRLARIGGDEFTVILDSLNSPHDAGCVAEKLIEQLSRQYDLEGEVFHLGASIGIACLPQCGGTVEDVLRAADAAMYAAKRSGRRQFRFSPGPSQPVT
ncbi:diguanylate cyclase domain-containing protein [Pseudomonas sp.]|uniref:diguanylate cyclase domain-containing protein n=1 Tax=Pseudomonas sp. TaxID=306 RepID=UPI002CB7722E|nr:diguanylate cyclase [Pseudomonas sp.]